MDIIPRLPGVKLEVGPGGLDMILATQILLAVALYGQKLINSKQTFSFATPITVEQTLISGSIQLVRPTAHEVLFMRSRCAHFYAPEHVQGQNPTEKGLVFSLGQMMLHLLNPGLVIPESTLQQFSTDGIYFDTYILAICAQIQALKGDDVDVTGFIRSTITLAPERRYTISDVIIHLNALLASYSQRQALRHSIPTLGLGLLNPRPALGLRTFSRPLPQSTPFPTRVLGLSNVRSNPIPIPPKLVISKENVLTASPTSFASGSSLLDQSVSRNNSQNLPTQASMYGGLVVTENSATHSPKSSLETATSPRAAGPMPLLGLSATECFLPDGPKSSKLNPSSLPFFPKATASAEELGQDMLEPSKTVPGAILTHETLRMQGRVDSIRKCEFDEVEAMLPDLIPGQSREGGPIPTTRPIGVLEKLTMGYDAYMAEMASRRECAFKEQTFSGASSKNQDAHASYSTYAQQWGLADVGKEFRGGLGLGLGL